MKTIKYVKGDLIRDAEQFDIIGHGCNCYLSFGAGIAKDVKIKYSKAYEEDLKTQYGDKGKLGNYTKYDTGKVVVLNLYTQFRYGNSEINADYDAIRSCMKSIKEDYSGKKIGLPLIGAGLAQGDWGLISKIIEDELQGEDVTIVVWEHSRESWQLKLIEENNNVND